VICAATELRVVNSPSADGVNPSRRAAECLVATLHLHGHVSAAVSAETPLDLYCVPDAT
jgi:hypothetical protein